MHYLKTLLDAFSVRGGLAEIGVLEGDGSTPIFCEHVRQHGGTLDSVDLFSDQAIHDRVKARFDLPGMRTLAGYSVDVGLAFDRRLSFLFIDGDHGFPRITPRGIQSGVALDILAWHPHLDVGGFLVFHDYTGTDEEYGIPGMLAVEHAVDALCREPHYEFIGQEGCLRAFRKRRHGVLFPGWRFKRPGRELAEAWERLDADIERITQGVAVFGTGETSWQVLNTLRELHGHGLPICFTSSSTHEPGTSWDGLPLLPLGDVAKGCPIIVGSIFEQEIFAYLQSLGLSHLDDFFGFHEFVSWYHIGRFLRPGSSPSSLILP